MLVAAVAGVLSFLSPCVLPIVPPYLAFMAGASMDEMAEGRRDPRVLRAAVFFVLGLSTVFLLLAFAASAFGRVLLAYQETLTQVAGGVIVLFGLHFLGVLRLPLVGREARFEAAAATGTALGAYVFGLAFAFGWTPASVRCSAPSSLSQPTEPSLERGLPLMAAYALGLGMPFLLTALFLGRALGLMAGIKRHLRAVEIATGLLLVAVGLTMLTGAFSRFSFWLLETFPALGRIG